MEAELGAGNKKPEILEKLAQYELTLLDWVEAHKGYRKYVTLTGKMLACIPDTVWFRTLLCKQPSDKERHSGILLIDIYGTLSEFIGTVASEDAVTLGDINNTVPADIYNEDIKGKFGYTQKDTFMGIPLWKYRF